MTVEELRLRCRAPGGPSLYRIGARRFTVLRCELDELKASPANRYEPIRALPEAASPKVARGLVYIIGSGKHVKLGFTSKDARKRLAHLQIGSAEKLTLLATIPGSIELEKRLHLRFASLRSAGEWFRREGELAAWIAEGCPINAA